MGLRNRHRDELNENRIYREAIQRIDELTNNARAVEITQSLLEATERVSQLAEVDGRTDAEVQEQAEKIRARFRRTS